MVTKQLPPLALVAVVVLLFSFPVATRAQDKRDIVSVRTRVVLVDTLVQDKKTGAPVADLTRENFEVLADGKPRTLAYFSRAGEGRWRYCSSSISSQMTQTRICVAPRCWNR